MAVVGGQAVIRRFLAWVRQQRLRRKIKVTPVCVTCKGAAYVQPYGGFYDESLEECPGCYWDYQP